MLVYVGVLIAVVFTMLLSFRFCIIDCLIIGCLLNSRSFTRNLYGKATICTSLYYLHFISNKCVCFPLYIKGNQESISRNKLHSRMNQCTRGVPLATTYFPFFPRFDFRINMMSDVLTRKHSGQVHIGHFQKIIPDTYY